MASTNVFSAQNVKAPSAPPSYYVPNSNGFNVPNGHSFWVLAIDTTGLPANAPLGDFAVEYLSGGQWIEDVLAQGALTGPYPNGSYVWKLASSLSVTPYPTKARIRVDSCPGYTFPSVTLTLE